LTLDLCSCQTFVTLEEEHSLRVFEVRVLRRVFERKWEDREKFIRRSFISFTTHNVLLG
jgi:hypothetical protein